MILDLRFPRPISRFPLVRSAKMRSKPHQRLKNGCPSSLRVTIECFTLVPGVISQMQLSINNVSMRFGAHVLFEDVNTTFISGRRYAITGPNGAGKSTLMKILTGEIDPEKGSVTRPKKMGVLRQDQFAFDSYRVMDTVIMGNRPTMGSPAGARDSLSQGSPGADG